MVGGLERGEGSEEELRASKLISSWAYTAKPGDSSVECLAVYQEGQVESSASIAFVVKEEQVVTLRNIEDKTKVEEDALLNNNDARKSTAVTDNLEDEVEKKDVELTKKKEAKPVRADADAVDTIVGGNADAVDVIAGFAAAPEEQFFDAGEEKVEAVDSKVGRSGTSGNKVEVVASAMNTLASNASSPLFSSFLLLLLLISQSLAI